jgi:glucose-6-phosphate 1-dehydrogenase
MKTLIKPTVHMNGTSAKSLAEQYANAGYALNAAIMALEAIDVNGRDYYPQGDGVIQDAIKQHAERIRQVVQVREENTELWAHCDQFVK